MQNKILNQIIYNLLRKCGTIRYRGDRYTGIEQDDGVPNLRESEWCFGFPWLSVIYTQQGKQQKARKYLKKTQKITIDGRLPESYLSEEYQDKNLAGKPNDNYPLNWADAMHGIALEKYKNKFNTEFSI